jgi:YidC/Oxa1 family membrane protein insertase
VLVAPSWHDENILALCLEPLVAALGGGPYDVVVRPHPEDVKRRARLVADVEQRLRAHPNLTLELPGVAGTSIHEADVLVTDWSAISFEYAFGTERPVLFVDTPCKVHNPNYAELGIEPIEFSSRKRLGRAIEPGEVSGIGAVVADLLGRREAYRAQIVAFREETLFHWMRAAQVGGDALLALCRRHAAAAPAGGER